MNFREIGSHVRSELLRLRSRSASFSLWPCSRRMAEPMIPDIATTSREPALELHEKMRRVVHGYSSLREAPEAEDHPSEVLLAADETINVLIEISDQMGKVLVCMGVWEYTPDEDLGA